MSEDIKIDTSKMRELRKIENLLQSDVAKKINVKTTSVQKWEKGTTPIPTKYIIKLAELFGTNIDYLLNLTTVPNRVATYTAKMRFCKLREEARLTKKDLSSELGVDQKTVQRIETSGVEVTLKTLLRISNYYGVSNDYLCGLTECRTWDDYIGKNKLYHYIRPGSIVLLSDKTESDKEKLLSVGVKNEYNGVPHYALKGLSGEYFVLADARLIPIERIIDEDIEMEIIIMAKEK